MTNEVDHKAPSLCLPSLLPPSLGRLFTQVSEQQILSCDSCLCLGNKAFQVANHHHHYLSHNSITRRREYKHKNAI